MATSSIYVRPNTPLVPDTVKLSPFDQFAIRVYTPLLLLFKFDAVVENNAICSDLQLGLASLINDMPFIAGNVVVEDDERDTLKIDIPEDAGVVFKVKEMLISANGPVLDFEELERARFPSSQLDPSHLAPRSIFLDPTSPVLVVQATFIRGGMILTSYVHHSAMDGIGIMTLWERWSRHVSVMSRSCTLAHSQPFSAEALDRLPLLEDAGFGRSMYDFPGFECSRQTLSTQYNFSNRENTIDIENPSNLTIAYWHISSSSLKALTMMAKPTDNCGGTVTESCALSAYLWQHITRARQLDQTGIKTISICFCADARRRIDPPLHPQYLGNCVLYCQGDMPITELYSTKPDAICRIATLINDSMEWYSSDTIWQLLASMEAAPRIGDIKNIRDDSSGPNFKITDMSMLPLINNQWGPKLGHPCAVRLPGIYLLNGQVTVLPRLPDGGIEIVTYLDAPALERLKADPDFVKHIQFLCC